MSENTTQEADAALRLLTGPAASRSGSFWSVHIPALDVALTSRLSSRTAYMPVLRAHAENLALAVWDRPGMDARRRAHVNA